MDIYFYIFLASELISKVKLVSGVVDICLWDNNYLFISFLHSDVILSNI